jgi:hypothetical protein
MSIIEFLNKLNKLLIKTNNSHCRAQHLNAKAVRAGPKRAFLNAHYKAIKDKKGIF